MGNNLSNNNVPRVGISAGHNLTNNNIARLENAMESIDCGSNSCGVSMGRLLKTVKSGRFPDRDFYNEMYKQKNIIKSKQKTLDDVFGKNSTPGLKDSELVIIFIRHIACDGQNHVFALFKDKMFQSYINEYTAKDHVSHSCTNLCKKPGTLKVDMAKVKYHLQTIIEHKNDNTWNEKIKNAVRTLFLCNSSLKINNNFPVIGKDIQIFTIDKDGVVHGNNLVV